MNYTVKNQKGNFIEVDDKTMQGLIDRGIRKQEDFKPVVTQTSFSVDVPKPTQTVRESTRVEPQAPGQKTAEPKQSGAAEYLRESVRTAFPTATDTSKTTGQRIAGVLKDVGTMPMRQLTGIGAGLGELAGGGNYFDAFKESARNPTKEVESHIGKNSEIVTSNARRLVAAAAEDPMTTVSLGMPVGGIANAAKLIGANVIGHAAQRYADGNATAGDYALGAGLDIVPGAAGLGMGKIASKVLGEAGKESAIASLMKTIKAAPMVKHGDEWKGLKTGLKGTVNGKPVFEHLTSATDMTPAPIVDRYAALKDAVDEGFRPSLEALQKTGVTVDLPKAVKQASKNTIERMSQGNHPVSINDQIAAEKWLKDHVYIPDDPGLASKLAEIQRNKLEPYTPVSGQYKGREVYKFSDKSVMPVDDLNDAVAYNLSEHDPLTAHFKKSSMAKEAFKADPDKQTARSMMTGEFAKSTRDQLTKKLRIGSVGAAKTITDYDDIAAKKAAGVWNERTLRNGNVIQTEIPRSQWTKDQLATYKAAKQEIVGNRNIAKQGYEKQLQNSAPLYAMEDAMDRALRTRGNNNRFGLGDIALGLGALGSVGGATLTPWSLLGLPVVGAMKYANTPGFARMQWNLAKEGPLQDVTKLASKSALQAMRSAATLPGKNKKEGK